MLTCHSTQVFAKAKEAMILFYGEECPHCQNVITYLQEHRTINCVEKKEVYSSNGNRTALLDTAKKCKISENEIGLPLLWTGNKCVIGDKDIIGLFDKTKK
jgi:glutaredoxin-related protein